MQHNQETNAMKKDKQFAKCALCGRTIRLTKYGMFRRHNGVKSTLCLGSWRHWQAIRFSVDGTIAQEATP